MDLNEWEIHALENLETPDNEHIFVNHISPDLRGMIFLYELISTKVTLKLIERNKTNPMTFKQASLWRKQDQ